LSEFFSSESLFSSESMSDFSSPPSSEESESPSEESEPLESESESESPSHPPAGLMTPPFTKPCYTAATGSRCDQVKQRDQLAYSLPERLPAGPSCD
jgi:hypothetical protein